MRLTPKSRVSIPLDASTQGRFALTQLLCHLVETYVKVILQSTVTFMCVVARSAITAMDWVVDQLKSEDPSRGVSSERKGTEICYVLLAAEIHPFLPLVQPYNLWYTALCEVQDTCTLLYQQAFSFFFNGKDTSVIVTHNAAVCVELLLIVEPWESLPHTISWGSHEFREAWIRQTMWKWLHVHPL